MWYFQKWTKYQNVENVAIVRNSFSIFGGKIHASQIYYIIIAVVYTEYRYIGTKNNWENCQRPVV